MERKLATVLFVDLVDSTSLVSGADPEVVRRRVQRFSERAVRAGLAILDSVHELELEARIGIEAGEVVADDSDSTFATGEAVNVAARLERAAEPGQILMGPGAHRL